MHDHHHGERAVLTDRHVTSASVTLDIGAGRGALLIYPAERFRGTEIEITPANAPRRRVHTGVHERRTIAGSRLTAIFGSLPAGTYEVWEDAETVGAVVTVTDGEVAETTLA